MPRRPKEENKYLPRRSSIDCFCCNNWGCISCSVRKSAWTVVSFAMLLPLWLSLCIRFTKNSMLARKALRNSSCFWVVSSGTPEGCTPPLGLFSRCIERYWQGKTIERKDTNGWDTAEFCGSRRYVQLHWKEVNFLSSNGYLYGPTRRNVHDQK